uniref:Uncharacterized protein n=1 Tax=Caenorhabditis japonica TaxID=281687 RepID=A0A8R1I4M9_CAEJA
MEAMFTQSVTRKKKIIFVAIALFASGDAGNIIINPTYAPKLSRSTQHPPRLSRSPNTKTRRLFFKAAIEPEKQDPPATEVLNLDFSKNFQKESNESSRRTREAEPSRHRDEIKIDDIHDLCASYHLGAFAHYSSPRNLPGRNVVLTHVYRELVTHDRPDLFLAQLNNHSKDKLNAGPPNAANYFTGDVFVVFSLEKRPKATMDDLNRSFDRILDIKNHKFWIVDELALFKRNIRLNKPIWHIRTIQETQSGNETEHPQNGLPRDHMNRKCLCVAYNVNQRSFLAPPRKTKESRFRRHF